MEPSLPRWYRNHAVRRIAAPPREEFVPDLELLPNSPLRGDPEVELLLFLNRMSFIYVAVACTAMARSKGISRAQVAESMGRPVEWLRWIENGVDPSGRPIGAEIIEYATVLGYRVSVDVKDFESWFPKP